MLSKSTYPKNMLKIHDYFNIFKNKLKKVTKLCNFLLNLQYENNKREYIKKVFSAK